MPGTSVTVSYFRRDYKDLIWSDNIDVAPSDYTRFEIPDPRGNGQMLPVYNLNPAKASAFNLVDDNSSSNFRRYNGFDVNFNSRMRDLTLFGGVSFGHQLYNTCETEDPNQLRFCDSVGVRHPVLSADQDQRQLHPALAAVDLGHAPELRGRRAQQHR